MGSVAGGIRDRVLSTIGGLARRMPGYGLLCVVIGRDVMTQQPVARDATNIIGTLVGLMPGGAAVWENLQQSGAVARAGEWVSQELTRLNLTWEAVHGLFSRAWDAVSASDLLNPMGVWLRLSGLFSDPINRLVSFARGAAGKLMEFVFEGVLSTAGGAGGQVIGILRRAGSVLGTIVRGRESRGCARRERARRAPSGRAGAWQQRATSRLSAAPKRLVRAGRDAA